jgi:flavin-dependent dehydrogenase
LRRVEIIGGGPAGTAAALACLADGAAARIHEKSPFPRHKVCGEFLSPEVASVLDLLGIWDGFIALNPAPIQRAVLHFGTRAKRWKIPDTAYGLSRYTLDDFLLRQAAARGAEVVRDVIQQPETPAVIAHGRRGSAVKGQRLFGFKAHFQGPPDDAVELYFFNGCYAGVSPVEGGVTNVCGLAPEGLLAKVNFEIESILATSPPVVARIAPIKRCMDWVLTGPLVFKGDFTHISDGLYPAGDALGFIDPFTGSGILTALETGRLAGECAARGIPTAHYMARCRGLLATQYRVAHLTRVALQFGLGPLVTPLLPGRLLFWWTRPKIKMPTGTRRSMPAGWPVTILRDTDQTL